MNTIAIVGEDCFGCTACKHICPVGCITMESDSKGFLSPVIDTTHCTECGLCLEICPALEKGESKRHPDPRVFAVKHRDDTIRETSASGGAFSSIAEYILDQGGVVYGAAYDSKMHVRHMRCATKEMCEHLRGSKYVQSDLGDSFTNVEQDLQKGTRVLFTGTPCQVAGLRSFLGKEYERLLLVDLLCYGVPSPKIFSEYVAQVEQQEGKPLLNCTFRDKSKGWRNLLLNLDFGSKQTLIEASSSPFYSFFLKGTTLRSCCFTCKFCSFDRKGDITIGDFWGIENAFPQFEDKRGVSLLLLNSPKGERAFKEFSSYLIYKQSTQEASLQPALATPTPRTKDRDLFWKEYALYGYPYVANKYGRP